ncbi:MAG: peptidase S41, partial [Tannerellaceae bacterium]|jgi:carboxyl-terminal processing protease|nr:peptidase S41 [Tannerellaceae bacterium]
LGGNDDYEQDIYNRYLHGEFDSADSIRQDENLRFETLAGRTVYGGGGIMPDIFIPRDTAGLTSYYTDLVNSGLLYRYVLDYSDRHHRTLTAFDRPEALHDYLRSQPLLEDAVRFAAEAGIRRRPALIAVSARLIENQLHAYIVRNFFDDAGFYPIVLKDDPTLRRAVEELKANNTPGVPNIR